MAKKATNKKRARRSPEQIIADLESEIARIKTRAERQKARRDPCLRHVSSAIRSLDKAAAKTEDAVTRNAIAEARATLAACLALEGGGARGGAAAGLGASRPLRPVEPEAVLGFLQDHPGSRSEEIAAKLETDTVSLRKVLNRLRDEGKVAAEGKARATRYRVVG